MNSTTLIALAGIGGTLLGAVVGAVASLGAARIASRTQVTTEAQKARRQAYSACATALLARRDAVAALLDVFRDDVLDQASIQARIQTIDEQRDAVARAVGVVMIEGPYDTAHDANQVAKTIEITFGRLRDWAAEVADGRDVQELLTSQAQYARMDLSDVEISLDRFTHACRRMLRPAEFHRQSRWVRMRRARRLRRMPPA